MVEEKTHIFDDVRKKYLLLTPEEWVRQNFIHYLNKEKKYPLGLMGVEQMVKYNSLKTRADIVIYNLEGKPNVIVECKAPEVKITQDTFNQIAKYNSQLKVKYLIVTNGMKHFCCQMDYENNKITFLEDVPAY
ncbi:MAG: type I restriction enzyme HsdR N-terminal domain-containing protein [Flavobacteriales bacterium]|jgi:type I site-specific restriction endonuclease|nr:type I restriction enzyme HsdR N-terminal domain-containing protein [Flavobacteriales bacterium]MBT6808384.1 type I restriction enzyme HsdR N-terminal domain-containing protein [Flavobacteriales bacterium]